MTGALAKAISKLPSDWLIYEEMARCVSLVDPQCHLCHHGIHICITNDCVNQQLVTKWRFLHKETKKLVTVEL